MTKCTRVLHRILSWSMCIESKFIYCSICRNSRKHLTAFELLNHTLVVPVSFCSSFSPLLHLLLFSPRFHCSLSLLSLVLYFSRLLFRFPPSLFILSLSLVCCISHDSSPFTRSHMTFTPALMKTCYS